MGSMMLRLLALLTLPSGAALAQGVADWAWLETDAPAAWEVLTAAGDFCAAETGGGALEIGTFGIVTTDLDGDIGTAAWGGPDDVVVDFNHIFCDRAVSLWAGTGGSPVYFVLDGTVARAWYGFGWEVERMSADLPAVILLARHGGACDGAGAVPCVQAIVAEAGRFWTLRYPEEWEGFGAE